MMQATALNINIMGQSQYDNAIQNVWEAVGNQASQNYLVVRDKSGREGEEYQIKLDPDAILYEEFKIYNLRKSTPNQVVAVYGSESNQHGSLCVGDLSIRVITEHLCIRFSQTFQLNLQEVLYVLVEAMRGFAYLYSKVGCFNITANMLGLTSEGELKVWMHQIYGRNCPQLPKRSIITAQVRQYSGVSQEESHMIKQIFKIIEQHADKRVIDKHLGQYCLEKYDFRNINDIFIDVQQVYRIVAAQRIDIAKKNLQFQY